MNKKKTVSLVATVVIVGSLFAVRPTYAATGGFFGSNFFSEFITFISQKFGLDKTQVQTAVKDFQQQRKATITPRPTMTPEARTAAEKKRLDTLVSQGKITQAQEDAILAELAALWIKYPVDPNATPAQRKTQMTAMQTELKAWAQSNSIDIKYVTFFGQGREMGDDVGLRGSRRARPTQTP